MPSRSSSQDVTSLLTNRWLQSSAGILCMVMISSLQHGWTLFVHPIDEKHAWGRAAILVPLSEPVVIATGGWHAVFGIAVAMNLAAALLGIAVLRPVRAAQFKPLAVTA